MIPSWSNKHPGQRAKKIYNDAVIVAFVVGFAAFIALVMLFLWLANWLGWPEWTHRVGGLGGSFVAFTPLANARGVRALRRAGLVREQRQTVERTATNFAGETLKLRTSTIAGRLGLAAFFLILVAGCYWLWQSRPFDPLFHWIGGVGMMLFGVMALLIVYHADKPELRLDERGILNCQSWMSARLIRWESIARLERKRVWGLPPNYEPSEIATETVSLQDSNGKTLLILSAVRIKDAMENVWAETSMMQSAGAKLSQTQLFIAEIERRLRAATSQADF